MSNAITMWRRIIEEADCLPDDITRYLKEVGRDLLSGKDANTALGISSISGKPSDSYKYRKQLDDDALKFHALILREQGMIWEKVYDELAKEYCEKLKIKRGTLRNRVIDLMKELP